MSLNSNRNSEHLDDAISSLENVQPAVKVNDNSEELESITELPIQ